MLNYSVVSTKGGGYTVLESEQKRKIEQLYYLTFAQSENVE